MKNPRADDRVIVYRIRYPFLVILRVIYNVVKPGRMRRFVQRFRQSLIMYHCLSSVHYIAIIRTPPNAATTLPLLWLSTLLHLTAQRSYHSL